MQKEKKNYLDEICVYLRKNAKKGYGMESLKWALVKQGYPKIEVEKAIKKVESELAKDSSIAEKKPEITYKQIEMSEPAESQVVVEKRPFWKRLLGL